MRVIAFGHQKKVGKDTATRLLVTELRMSRINALDIGFADKVKDVSYQMYSYMGLKPRLYYEQHPDAKDIQLPGYHITPRDIWIHVGNKGREIDENCWIYNALSDIKADVIVIRDLRFCNEANHLLEKYGATRIKLEREGVPIGTDPAEIDMLNFVGWTKIIQNNGTLAELRVNVLEALK